MWHFNPLLFLNTFCQIKGTYVHFPADTVFPCILSKWNCILLRPWSVFPHSVQFQALSTWIIYLKHTWVNLFPAPSSLCTLIIAAAAYTAKKCQPSSINVQSVHNCSVQLDTTYEHGHSHWPITAQRINQSQLIFLGVLLRTLKVACWPQPFWEWAVAKKRAKTRFFSKFMIC